MYIANVSTNKLIAILQMDSTWQRIMSTVKVINNLSNKIAQK